MYKNAGRTVMLMLISLLKDHSDTVGYESVGQRPHTHWHASLWSQGPLCPVWGALTLGLWPLLGTKPFPPLAPLLHLLLEDHTLFILLASFLSSPLSLWSFVPLEAGAEHGFNAFTAEGTSTALVFTFDLRHFQASLKVSFHLCISTMSPGRGSQSRFLSSQWCKFIWNGTFWQLCYSLPIVIYIVICAIKTQNSLNILSHCFHVAIICY